VAGSTTDEYIFEKFAPAIKKFFKDNNTLSSNDAVDSMKSSEFIIVFEGRIFVLQSDLALLEPKRHYIATGSGEYHAYAAMQALQKYDPEITMTQMLKNAFEVTADVVMSVGGELCIITKKS
jgi:ATP-dependent protease HslVU (ClpYQ) peptidase subunit